MNNNRNTGLLLTAGVHLVAAALLLLCSIGLPPIQDSPLVIEFLPEEEPVERIEVPRVEIQKGREPRTPSPAPEKKVEVVQIAKAPEVVEGSQRTQESTIGEEGDVEKLEPEAPKINERALFRSRDNDTLVAEQTATIASDKPQAGHAQGNTLIGKTDGAPSAQLEGRTVVGQLPSPSYTENTSGKVVVRILVDSYGKVTSATVRAAGTTVQSRTLWNAACKAALQARFNISGSAPAVQEGTITYIFSLR